MEAIQSSKQGHDKIEVSEYAEVAGTGKLVKILKLNFLNYCSIQFATSCVKYWIHDYTKFWLSFLCVINI